MPCNQRVVGNLASQNQLGIVILSQLEDQLLPRHAGYSRLLILVITFEAKGPRIGIIVN